LSFHFEFISVRWWFNDTTKKIDAGLKLYLSTISSKTSGSFFLYPFSTFHTYFNFKWKRLNDESTSFFLNMLVVKNWRRSRSSEFRHVNFAFSFELNLFSILSNSSSSDYLDISILTGIQLTLWCSWVFRNILASETWIPSGLFNFSLLEK